jgi:hypothetical protein
MLKFLLDRILPKELPAMDRADHAAEPAGPERFTLKIFAKDLKAES